MTAWDHDELAADLKATREACGEVAVLKLGLGIWGGSGQMDVLAFRLSRTQPRPTCYEVKVSRADFLADVRSGKFRRYESWSEFGCFAVPAGMVSAKEVPSGWGLLQRGPTGWHALRRGARRKLEPQRLADLYLAVHLARASAPWRRSRADRLREMEAAKHLRTIGYQIGGRVAEALTEAEEARWSLCTALGAPNDGTRSLWDLVSELRDRLRKGVAA